MWSLLDRFDCATLESTFIPKNQTGKESQQDNNGHRFSALNFLILGTLFTEILLNNRHWAINAIR